VRPGASGNWGYLAFAGRLHAREWLGSAATHVLAGLGGGSLEAGQELTIDACENAPAPGALPRPDMRSDSPAS
jgi:allophanate hydrolase